MTAATSPSVRSVQISAELSRPMPVVPSSVRQSESTSFLTIITLVVWMGCITVGFFGFVLPFQRPVAPVRELAPVQAQTLHVELAEDVPLPPEPTSPPPDILTPSVPEALIQPQIAAPVAVAEPLPSIAFAIPVEGPTRVVEASQATYVRPTTPPSPVAVPLPAAKPLTFGQGEGKQPAPEYPRRAAREGQEGTVVVRFSVGESGRVLAAEAASPCPWPLLNEEALRVIKNRWRFAGGAARLYEVAIRFELKK